MLRQYLYLSRHKLEWYLGQINADSVFRRENAKIISEAKLDLKLISASVKVEDTPLKTYFSSLKIVEAYIDKHHQPSAIDSGQPWIRGELEMQHVPIGKQAGVFSLIGRYRSTLILLAGSRANTALRERSEGLDNAAEGSRFEVLEEEIATSWFEDLNRDDMATVCNFAFQDNLANRSSKPLPPIGDQLCSIFAKARRQPVKVCFLARQLVWVPTSSKELPSCGIYTPLYVAQA